MVTQQLTEQQIELKRKKFNEKLDYLNPEDLGEYTSFNVNWIDGKNWNEVKEKTKETITNIQKLVFLAGSNDSISGKPQLIHPTKQRIPLIRTIQKTIKERGQPTKTLTIKKFLDEHYDKRYDGEQIDFLALDFWVYKTTHDGKDYYLFSENQLSLEYSNFKGMNIILDDVSEMSKSLKVKALSSVFIVKESNPEVKVVSKEELLSICKDSSIKFGWTAEGFQDFIFTHRDGNIYDYTPDFNLLRISQLLSGKYEGYPLHMMKVGPVGTGKTTEAETLDFKFNEQQGILEAGSSRMKVLVPSFKEKPANLGYICNCNRIAIIDELMKMITETINKVHTYSSSDCYLGEMNMILEQKKRMVGSGNDNGVMIKSTAKVCITTNPLQGKNTIHSHVGIIDPTTLSRLLIWVQDREEVNKIYEKMSVRVSPHTYARPVEGGENKNKGAEVSVCEGGNIDFLNYFLTIYDSCQEFICGFDMGRVKEILNNSIIQAKEPMKQIWRSRGLHHSILILDGITKFRCLFKDYDSEFIANDKDYEDLGRLLNHMVSSWETNFDQESWVEMFK